FLVDTLDHLLRIPVPDALMRMFLYVLRESGVKGVPSFDGFRKMQARLRESCGIPTIPCRSARGNVFYMVDPRVLLAQDWANPAVRPYIHVYPEIPDGPITEIWHTQKWHSGMDRSMLSPMFDAGEKHYYVDELSRLATGDLVIPLRWVIVHGEVHFDAHRVNLDATTVRHYFSFLVLHQQRSLLTTSIDPLPFVMPNPLRETAEGDPLYSSFVNHFIDDVSGNRSKSWNKHINTYMTHANLPRKILQQEAHIHFVSTSPHATAAEQACDFKRVITATHHSPVRTVDAVTGRSTRFRIFVHAEPSDNPMQSELSGHIGGNGNHFCRKCEAGGTTAFKSTDEGFHSLFSPGQPRSKESVLAAITDQVKLACLGVESKVREKQTETGVKDAYTEHAICELLKRAREERRNQPERTKEDIQEELLAWVDANPDAVYNPVLTMPGLDPTRDTPVEILHTVLLGVVKYAWHWTHTSLTPAQKVTYAQRLQATDTDGLSGHAIRANYIIQYANSLIGRQLKTVAQTTAFHTHDMLSPLHFKLWLAVGDMTALIWTPEIDNEETYKADLTVAIANVLDIFAEIDPTKILEKVKLHVLSHAVEDVSRFGPLVGMASEGFESFHGVFRNSSVHSNHLAPSRDIARELADHEAHKHRLMGGMWLISSGKWVQAGTRVRDFLHKNPTLQRLFGWSVAAAPTAGTFKLAPVTAGQKERPVTSLGSTQARDALNAVDYSLTSIWAVCRNVVSCAQDICIKGTWVCAHSTINPSVPIIGRIDELLADKDSGKAIVILDVFEIAASRHPIFGMPWLVRRLNEPSFVIVDVSAIRFSFNVQHDCASAGCSATGERPVRQERVESSVHERFIVHKHDIQRFVINMHSLHNTHLIRSVLPRSLVAPLPHFADRRQEHRRLAQALRETQQHKRAAANARKAAKKATEPGGTMADASGSAQIPPSAGAATTGTNSYFPGNPSTTAGGSTELSDTGARKRRRVDDEDNGAITQGPS
ncbi:hypothetical protein BV20DRAFT_948572, partial [Pilatotrama ljubarskyi]